MRQRYPAVSGMASLQLGSRSSPMNVVVILMMASTRGFPSCAKNFLTTPLGDSAPKSGLADQSQNTRSGFRPFSERCLHISFSMINPSIRRAGRDARTPTNGRSGSFTRSLTYPSTLSYISPSSGDTTACQGNSIGGRGSPAFPQRVLAT